MHCVPWTSSSYFHHVSHTQTKPTFPWLYPRTGYHTHTHNLRTRGQSEIRDEIDITPSPHADQHHISIHRDDHPKYSMPVCSSLLADGHIQTCRHIGKRYVHAYLEMLRMQIALSAHICDAEDEGRRAECSSRTRKRAINIIHRQPSSKVNTCLH